MATLTATSGKRITVSIEEKARALHVFDIQEEGRLAVVSGTVADLAYVVRHDGERATFCPCGSYKKCSHKVAAEWYLEAKARAAFVALNDPCGLAVL